MIYVGHRPGIWTPQRHFRCVGMRGGPVKRRWFERPGRSGMPHLQRSRHGI